MASKKCPKCGEDNPAEAVMCWACYTPLSGSAPLGAGLAAGATAGTLPKTAGAPVGVPDANEPAKKGLDPKAIGIGAFLLVGGLAAVMMSGVLGGAPEDDGTPAPGVDPPPAAGAPAPAAGVPAPAMSGAVAAGGAPPAPVPAPFTTVASPGGRYKTGTVGILLTGGTSPAGAAKFAKDQFARNGNWTNMQVAVFVDKATADAFGDFQRKRDSAPLTNADFKQLADAGVWNRTPAFLDTRGRQERIYNPSQRPLAWWPSR